MSAITSGRIAVGRPLRGTNGMPPGAVPGFFQKIRSGFFARNRASGGSIFTKKKGGRGDA